jgi:hypothetical protein
MTLDYANITPQEIVDRVWARLNDGKGQAYDLKKGVCTYLDDNGNKCAVGVFLPEINEVQKYQGSLGNLLAHCKNAGGYDGADWVEFLNKNKDLLIALQKCHDAPAYWNGENYNRNGKIHFKIAVLKFGLKFPGDEW